MKLRTTFLFVISAMLLTVSALSVDVCAAKKKQRTINSVKREQQAAQKSIKETTRKLDVNTKQTEQNLRKLNELEGELQVKNEEIGRIRSSLQSIDMHIRSVADSASLLEQQLQNLKSEYARALRKLQGSYRDSNLMSFLFSSGSFSEAAARYRYLREFAGWRKRKQAEIARATQLVAERRRELGKLQSDRRTSLSTLAGAESELRVKRDETDRVVTRLKQEGSALQSVIASNQQKLKKLDSELDRMIVAEQKRQEALRKAEAKRKEEAKRKAEEQKKAKERKRSQSQKGTSATKSSGNTKTTPAPARHTEESGLAAADRALSGSFESNKGRLLFPVRGRYTVVRAFGRQTHPDLPNVVTDNSGIDIAAAAGSKARCIFEGTVSGVFSQDGYNKVVMIRHGNYISSYANLSAINVKTGDKVKANQDIGTISPDPQSGNRPVLHFEIRRERTKLNPLQWVK